MASKRPPDGNEYIDAPDAYDLVVMKDGAKIKPTDLNHPFTQPPRMPGACCMMVAYRGKLDEFALGISGTVGRPVVNKTGLEGPYTWALQYARLDSATSAPTSAPDIFAAIQQQLGLKLESDKAAIPTLTVDHADRIPTGN